MENTYSITVKNKFAISNFEDDEEKDPFEILKLKELEKEAKRKEKLSEKSKHQQEQQQKAATAGQQPQQPSNKKTSKLNKENQAQGQQAQQQQQQQPARAQDTSAKKDQGDKKPPQQRTGGERNVKFLENREEHNNKRNREEGDRPPRQQNERRGPPGEQRGDFHYQGSREFRNSNINSGAPEGERRRGPLGGGAGSGGGPRGGFRGGRGGYRGGRGGFDNRGKREYDRQSGSDKTYGYSGVKSIDKKDGAGSHNWGTHNDEIEESLNHSDDWGTAKIEPETSGNVANENKDSVGSANVSGGEAPATGEAAPATEEKTAEEEARELTLDEYKALRQTNRVKPTYNLRKAGEGEDLSRWKKMYALERKKEGAEEEDEDEEYDAAEYPQRAGRQKHVFDIEINFNDSRRSGGRGGRGGRGGNRMNGRGFGNRGPPREGAGEYRSQEQRSPRERQNAPKVDDEHDFPSLG